MEKVKNLLGLFIVAIAASFTIYSCTKDGNTGEKQKRPLTSKQIKELKLTLGFDENVEIRSAMAGASCGNTTNGCFLLQASKLTHL